MHLGIIQTAPIFGDKESNRREIERLAEDRHADLWIMPELALTGYEFRDRPELASLAEEIPGGETCEWLVKFCAARDTHAVIGLAERTEEHVYNSCILAGPEKIIGHYRKLHLFDAEHERFDPGNLPLPVYDLGFARVGLMICFDWRYPEAARTLMLRGAQLIAHPSNLVAPYCQAAMVTRALENRAFFATVNRIGSEDRAGRTVRFTGRSVVVDPKGETLMLMSRDRVESQVIEMDPSLADDKWATPYNHLVQGLRPEFYLNEPKLS